MNERPARPEERSDPISGNGTHTTAPVAGCAGPRSRSHTSYHVIASEKRWSVVKSGAQRAARVFASQPEAVEYALKVAGPAAVEVVVHRRDGSVARRIPAAAKPASR